MGRRLHILFGTASVVALIAGGLRIIKSVKVSRSYGYLRKAVIAHPTVVAALGERASISTSQGTFGSTYLNARLRLVGDGGGVADVDFAATRTLSAEPWCVVLARISWAGRTENLDR